MDGFLIFLQKRVRLSVGPMHAMHVLFHINEFLFSCGPSMSLHLGLIIVILTGFHFYGLHLACFSVFIFGNNSKVTLPEQVLNLGVIFRVNSHVYV